jgi:hypothetical protein
MQRRLEEFLYKPELLAELAQEFELSDPIDWGLLPIREEEAYQIIAENVCDIVNNSEDRELVCMVAMTKLLVENFVLNLQLAGFGSY